MNVYQKQKLHDMGWATCTQEEIHWDTISGTNKFTSIIQIITKKFQVVNFF